jgi:hypothetical protein
MRLFIFLLLSSAKKFFDFNDDENSTDNHKKKNRGNFFHVDKTYFFQQKNGKPFRGFPLEVPEGSWRNKKNGKNRTLPIYYIRNERRVNKKISRNHEFDFRSRGSYYYSMLLNHQTSTWSGFNAVFPILRN